MANHSKKFNDVRSYYKYHMWKKRQVVNAAKRLELPIVENPCPANGETRRQEIKELIASLEGRYPDLKQKIFGAMQRYPLYGWGVGGEDK